MKIAAITLLGQTCLQTMPLTFPTENGSIHPLLSHLLSPVAPMLCQHVYSHRQLPVCK